MKLLLFDIDFLDGVLSGDALCGIIFLYLVFRAYRDGRVKKIPVPDPHPQKYAYRSLLVEVLLCIVMVGALVAALCFMHYI